MMPCQFGENFLSFKSKGQQHFTAIALGAVPMNIPSLFEAIHQFDGTVVADLHALSQLADARPRPLRHAFDCQHELILPTLEARSVHCLLAEMEKPANLVAEFSESLVVRGREFFHADDWLRAVPAYFGSVS